MPPLSAKELARCLDQTLFAPEASRRDLEQFCAEARELSFRSVCVNSSRVELACTLLEESGVQVTALVGFPLGAADADVKSYETEIAVDHGAHEIDFVLNPGRLKDGDRRGVLREMRDVVEAADERPVKIMLGTTLLTRDEKLLACELALDSGAQFVGSFSFVADPGALIDDIHLLRTALGEKFGVKAGGNIHDLATAQALVEAGATRLGTIAGAALVRGLAG